MAFVSLMWLLFTPLILANSDCYWVKIIYRKMGGDATGISNCCGMSGVTCRDNKVIEILWFDEDLSGSIPTEISHLTNLVIL